MKRRRGFAMVTSIMALVLIGFLVTAALFSSGQESRATRAQAVDSRLFALAEAVAMATGSSWDCPDCDVLKAGSVIIRNAPASPPFESSVYITRLDTALFVITGEAKISSPASSVLRRRVSIVVTITRDTLGLTRVSPLRDQYWAAVYSP